MSSLIRFEYQYRDADNYKKCGELFFSNPNERSIESVLQQLRSSLLDSVWFVAQQIQVADLFIYDDVDVSEADHCFHEFVAVEKLEVGEHFESVAGPIESLMDRVEAAAAEGWSVFDPLDRVK